MTPQEAFKVGFALRCADEALAPNEIPDRLARAKDLLEKAALVNEVVAGAAPVAHWGALAALAAPIGIGAASGYALQKSTESDVDDEDVKKRELISELKHWSRRAKWQKSMKTLP